MIKKVPTRINKYEDELESMCVAINQKYLQRDETTDALNEGEKE